jgi:TRAP-type transport system periplasmic protein
MNGFGRPVSRVAAVGLLAFATLGSGIAQGETILRFGNHYEPNHPNNSCGVAFIEERLAESGADIGINNFPAGQLGTMPEMLEQVSIGELEMAMGAPADIGRWHEPLNVMDAAYAFDDFEQIIDFVESEEGQSLYAGVLENMNARIIGTWLYGTRHMTANQPLRAPEDLEGLRIRAPDARIMLANVEAMGGRATPMAFGEVYLGLQQGIIDAQENPLPSIDTMNFYEVQDYLILTGHQVATTLIVVAEPVWQGLTDEQRDALAAAVENAAEPVRECIEREEQELLERWREGGEMTIVEDVDLEAFRERAQAFFSDEDRFSWAPIYQALRGN